MDVALDAFAGPLDLLVQLIVKNKIDIMDIPIAKLTDDYLAALEQMQPNFHEVADFLVLAATLLEIKSAMLLPRPPAALLPDPRESLRRDIEDYMHAKNIAQQLSQTPNAGRLFVRDELFEGPKLPTVAQPAQMLEGVSVEALFEAFRILQARVSAKEEKLRTSFDNLKREQYTVEQKIAQISAFFSEVERVRLFDLFADCRSRLEIVVMFLALLELMRRGSVEVFQSNAYADCWLSRCPA